MTGRVSQYVFLNWLIYRQTDFWVQTRVLLCHWYFDDAALILKDLLLPMNDEKNKKIHDTTKSSSFTSSLILVVWLYSRKPFKLRLFCQRDLCHSLDLFSIIMKGCRVKRASTRSTFSIFVDANWGILIDGHLVQGKGLVFGAGLIIVAMMKDFLSRFPSNSKIIHFRRRVFFRRRFFFTTALRCSWLDFTWG